MENGYYKLTWRQRIGFSAGDLAQNLIYQTVSIWLLFFYTNVYGLNPASSALMFLIVRIIDIRLKEEYTFQLEECPCGDGILDIGLYARLADMENPDMPMIIEHLSTDEEYDSSVRYVKERIGL